MTHREKGQTMIDLHLHSDASDGTLKPAEVLRAAKEKGLYAFALTDPSFGRTYRHSFYAGN